MAKKITGQDLFDVSSFDQATQQIVGLIGKINQAINGAKGEVDKLSTKLGTDLKNQINNVSSSSDKLEKELADVKTKFEQLKTTVSTSNGVIKKYEEENKRLETQLKKVKEEATKYANAQKESNKAQKDAGVTSAGLSQSLLGVASGAALVYKGITMLKDQIGAAVSSMMEFEQAMKEVQAITRASSEQLGVLTENANRLGATTEKTAGDIAKLQKELGKLGFNTSEIVSSTDAIVNLSTATGEGLAGSATIAAATLRAFGLEATEMGRVVDVMAGSFVRSGLDLEKFRESMKLVAPLARATNIDIETTTASLSKLADAGLSGSLAGTALRNLFSNMADPTSKLSKFLGYTVENSEDLIKAFKDLRDQGIGLAEAVQMVDVRARPAFFTLMNQIDAVEGLSMEYKDLEGEAYRLASTMRDTLTNDVAIANSAFDAMRRNLVELFTPAMRQGTQDVTLVSEALRFLINDIKNSANQMSESESTLLKWVSGFTSLKFIIDGAREALLDYTHVASGNELTTNIAKNVKAIGDLAKEAEREIELYEKLRTSFDEGTPIVGLVEDLKGLGEEYDFLSKKITENGEKEEDVAKRVFIELEKQLSSKKGSIQQQAVTLRNLEAQRKVLADIEESGETLNRKDAQRANFLDDEIDALKKIISETSKLETKLVDILKKPEIPDFEGGLGGDLGSVAQKFTDLATLRIKLAEEIVKSSISANEDILKNDKDSLQTRRQLAEAYKIYQKELIELAWKAEKQAIELSVDGTEQKTIRKLIAEEKYYRELAELQRKFDGDFKKAEENVQKEANKRGQQGLKDAKERLKQSEADGKEYVKNIENASNESMSSLEKLGKEWEENWEMIVARALQELSKVTTEVFTNQQIARENELRSIDNWEQRRIELAGDNAEAIQAIELEAEKKRNEVRRRQAKADKKEAIFQIAIQTAVGIMREVARGGYIMAAVIGALGIAQAAVVANRPLPEFYKGTDDSPEGLAVVGDRYGRELIQDGKTGEYRLTPNKATVQYLSEGSKVFTNKETERILSSVDHNGIAVGKLSGATQERKQPPIDYNKLGKTFEDAVTKIPVSTTNFDQNGVRTFVTKGRNRTERLNNRYKY